MIAAVKGRRHAPLLGAQLAGRRHSVGQARKCQVSWWQQSGPYFTPRVVADDSTARRNGYIQAAVQPVNSSRRLTSLRRGDPAAIPVAAIPHAIFITLSFPLPDRARSPSRGRSWTGSVRRRERAVRPGRSRPDTRSPVARIRLLPPHPDAQFNSMPGRIVIGGLAPARLDAKIEEVPQAIAVARTQGAVLLPTR